LSPTLPGRWIQFGLRVRHCCLAIRWMPGLRRVCSVPQIHQGYHPDNTHCLRELCHSVFPQVGASKQWIENARHRSYSRIALPAGELRLGERKLEFVILEVTRSEMFVGGPTTLGGTALRILLPLLPIGILEEALIVPRLWRDDGWCPHRMEFRSDPHTAHLQGIFLNREIHSKQLNATTFSHTFSFRKYILAEIVGQDYYIKSIRMVQTNRRLLILA
jgi:hypothetical protein